MTGNLHHVAMRPATVTAIDLDGELLLYVGEQLHRLQGGAIAIWRRIDDQTAVIDLVRDLEVTFGGPQGLIGEEVMACVDRLVALGLLELVPPELSGGSPSTSAEP